MSTTKEFNTPKDVVATPAVKVEAPTPAVPKP